MKALFLKSLFLTCLVLNIQAVKSQPWANPTNEKRAELLLSQMTMDEKLAYIGGENDFYIREIKRLGIPQIKMSDGPQGLRNDGKTNAFPCGIMLASTWNKELAVLYGKALGQDSKARGVHILLGPGVNIYRAPMCGRNFEYFGEDPYLTSRTAVNYINGVQSEGVMATIKHFAANNQEWDRYNVSSDVDDRTLNEIYFPAFEAAITEAHVGAVMSSYNLLNGVHTSQSAWLLTDVLRSKWGFKGILMSDWVATHNALEAANNGLDIEMPKGLYMSVDSLKYFIEKGQIDQKTIDEKVLRILRTLIGFGFIDKAQLDKTIPLDNPQSASVALNVAREGIVLLKNENQVLPILPSKINKIMVYGPNASTFQTGGGSGKIEPFHYVSTLDGIRKIATENNIEVVNIDMFLPIKNEFFIEKNSSILGFKAQFFNNMELKGNPIYQRIDTAINFKWNDGTGVAGLTLNNYSVRWTGIIRPAKTKNYNFLVGGDDGFRLYVNDNLVVDKWENGASTLRNGRVKLEANTEYDICVEFYQDAGGADFLFEASVLNDVELNEKFDDVDIIVACFGFNALSEMEGSDRNFALLPSETGMIDDLAVSGKPIVGIVNAGGNIEMQNWLPKLSALLWAWYPGQEGGTAIAEVLFGKVNPSGKLPITFEKKWADNPTYNSYYDTDTNKRVSYTEGIFVGYRGYDINKTQVQFPFGFGLSYSNFKLSNITVQNSTSTNSKAVVTCTIKNTSAIDGAEVVQLYVGGKSTKLLPQPINELIGFEKIFLKAGESKLVSFEVSQLNLSYYNTEVHNFVFDAGEYNFRVGNSSRNIQLEAKYFVK